MTVQSSRHFEQDHPFHQAQDSIFPQTRWSRRFRIFKRTCDLISGVLSLPAIALLCVLLIALNPFFNPGPLFFRQERMGLGGKRFVLWKFRTMAPETGTSRRGHNDPVEAHRITRLGRFLRQLRLDELPNFLNVLAGDMSLVGPRPDAYEHARHYLDEVPYYRDRFRVRPGITGLAQVRSGYADTAHFIRRKARFDRYYVHKSCGQLELRIILETFKVMLTGFGAK